MTTRYFVTQKDFFWDDDVGIVDVYFNPDADCGGQFVLTILPYNIICRAAKETDNRIDFFDRLDEIIPPGNVTFADMGTKDFLRTIRNYTDPDAVGRNRRTAKWLIATAKNHLIAEKREKLYEIL